jgi:hypothetical protein
MAAKCAANNPHAVPQRLKDDWNSYVFGFQFTIGLIRPPARLAASFTLRDFAIDPTNKPVSTCLKLISNHDDRRRQA